MKVSGLGVFVEFCLPFEHRELTAVSITALNKQRGGSGFTYSRLWDVAAGLPTVLLCLLGAAGFIIQIHWQVGSAPGIDSTLRIASEISSICFLLLQASLVLIRRLPTLGYSSAFPRLWAIICANFSYALILLPKSPSFLAGAIISSILLLVGTAGSALALLYLGRGFAVLPQARRLTMSGPYRVVRHPLYLFEQISMCGIALQYQQPWAAIIVVAGIALLFPRMSFEEKIMSDAFTEYRVYKKRTPQIVPWIKGSQSRKAIQ